MATDHVDHTDELCAELLREDRTPARRADTLFYSEVIMERVQDLLPSVEKACRQWPESDPARCSAEALMSSTREVMTRVEEMLKSPVHVPEGANRVESLRGRHSARARVTGQPQSDQATEDCQSLARALPKLKHFSTGLNRPGEAGR